MKIHCSLWKQMHHQTIATPLETPIIAVLFLALRQVCVTLPWPDKVEIKRRNTADVSSAYLYTLCIHSCVLKAASVELLRLSSRALSLALARG